MNALTRELDRLDSGLTPARAIRIQHLDSAGDPSALLLPSMRCCLSSDDRF